MATDKEVRVPDIGDFTDVEIIEVLVNEGDTVDVEAPLITLETDKAAMDVPAPFSGAIKEMKVTTGDKVSEGDVILVMTADAGDSPSPKEDAPAPAKAAEEPAPEPAKKETKDTAPKPAAIAPAPAQPAAQSELPPINEQSFTKAHASPSVRKFARELGVDLGSVTGSGPKSRITQEDVKAFVKQVMQRGGGAAASLPEVPAVDFAKFGEVEIKPLNRIKKISGPRLHASWVNVPHVTQHDEADITDLEAVRKALKSDAATIGAKITPLAFLVKACVQALKEFPEFNASLDKGGNNLVYKKYFHIGFAADTPNGLMVPVIKNADTKSVFDVAKELGDLSAQAREGKLKVADMQGGCFSISSLGSIGGTMFTPIVNAPEVAILGVSRSQMKPVWNGKDFEPRMMLPLSLSYDHRVIDGAAAARFTRFLADVLGEVRNLVL
ncbi:MAG: dihydrolipoyllysine-residue acetyltransferase [Gammaproteobacteria bacterium]|nr:dihydrolipoyllysine-residue acetyltransferase [Gammaproteobacteria bacterium]